MAKEDIKVNSIFDSFTRKYALSRTLRFELKPTSKLKELLKEHCILDKDYTIEDDYQQAKFYFDSLHREFFQFALTLEKVRGLSFGDLKKAYEKYQKLDKDEKRTDKIFLKETL